MTTTVNPTPATTDDVGNPQNPRGIGRAVRVAGDDAVRIRQNRRFDRGHN